MKKLLLLVILMAMAGIAYLYFVEGKRSIGEMRGEASSLIQKTGVESLLGTQETVAQKCITATGEVIYGEVPEGVRCQSIEKVEGSLTVVPKDVITGVNAPVHRANSQPGGAIPKTTPVYDVPKSKEPLNCATVSRCSQLASCQQARVFANNCEHWNIYDADRVACMQRWCED